MGFDLEDCGNVCFIFCSLLNDAEKAIEWLMNVGGGSGSRQGGTGGSGPSQSNTDALKSMGFAEADSRSALEASMCTAISHILQSDNVETAIEFLFSQQ